MPWKLLLGKAGLLLGLAVGRGPTADPTADPESRGDIAFLNHCAPCHLPDGRGVDGGGPPLADSSWVRGPDSRLIRIVLHGLRGPIDVGDQTYNREMLAFGPILSDEQIADLLTSRRRFGGEAASIFPSGVIEERSQPSS